MRDKLIDLITIGITRYSIQQASGNNPDMAAIIADVLIENDYCKASDMIEEIFAEIEEKCFDFEENFFFMSPTEFAELKKKYTEEGK